MRQNLKGYDFVWALNKIQAEIGPVILTPTTTQGWSACWSANHFIAIEGTPCLPFRFHMFECVSLSRSLPLSSQFFCLPFYSRFDYWLLSVTVGKVLFASPPSTHFDVLTYRCQCNVSFVRSLYSLFLKVKRHCVTLSSWIWSAINECPFWAAAPKGSMTYAFTHTILEIKKFPHIYLYIAN